MNWYQKLLENLKPYITEYKTPEAMNGGWEISLKSGAIYVYIRITGSSIEDIPESVLLEMVKEQFKQKHDEVMADCFRVNRNN